MENRLILDTKLLVLVFELFWVMDDAVMYENIAGRAEVIAGVKGVSRPAFVSGTGREAVVKQYQV